MLTCTVVFLHYNARLNTAAHTQAVLQYFSWELFDHPLHSPVLATKDHHLSTYLQEQRGVYGWFQNVPELTDDRLL
jgi:hypothetical protein